MFIDTNAKPKFEIYPLLSKNEVLEGGSTDLVYIIKYLGGSSQSSISNIKIKLDENPKSYEIEDENKEPFNFSLYENKRYKTKLTFLKSGSYTIPGIWLNEEYQTFGNINVNVKKFWENPLDLLIKYWILILAVIGLISAIVKIKTFRDKILLLLSWILPRKYADKLWSIYYKL